MGDWTARLGRLLGVMVVLGAVGVTRGQPAGEPLSTDRPDLTEGSSVVGAGRFQVETSVLYERDEEGVDTEGVFTPTLLRFGVAERLELRLGSEGLSYARTEGPNATAETTGYSPIEVGMKYRLREEGKAWYSPQTSVLVGVAVPSGSGAFALDKGAGEARLLLDWTLAPKWGLGANIGVGRDVDDADDSFWSGIVTVALAREWTDRVGTFWEVVYQGPESSEDDHAFLADTGVTFLINKDTQLDFAVGSGVSGEQVPDLFVTSGISMRF